MDEIRKKLFSRLKELNDLIENCKTCGHLQKEQEQVLDEIDDLVQIALSRELPSNG